MLKVGDLTQNESNSIFSDSGSIKLTPVVSAEWNQNIFNPPYLTVSGNASTTGITIGTPTGTTVTNVTDQALVKPNFTTKSITTSSGTVSVTYPITTNSNKAYKVVFFVKTNNILPLMISSYGDGDVNGSSSSEINSFGWTKIETYIGSTSDISSFDYVITANRMSSDDSEHTIYFSVPQVYETTYFDYQYHSIYPTDMVFTHFRPGESYVTTGNDNYAFPTNFRRIQNQILNIETLSGGYYGDKYMPVTPVINNPSFTLATVPVPVYKNILVSDMSQYKYFVSDLSSTGNPKISAIYESAVYSKKIVIKFNALMTVPNINLIIDGTTQTVDGSTTITADDNGVLILYWTGTAWSKTTKWSTMPKFDTNGSLTKYTTISKITIEQTGKTTRTSFTSYESASTYVLDDLTRMQVVEVSPRLEIDLTDYVENVSINKSLDSSNSVIPISSINSNDASITISNIPIDKSNLYIPLFSSQSNLNETILKNILRKNIKLYVNFKLDSYSVVSSNSFTPSGKFIPAGVFYSDSWEENDVDTVTVQAYDVSRYLQSTPVPDYVANLKNIFEIITNILDLAGYTDYDYDSLYSICNSKTMPLDLAYYYCNSKDTTIIGALSDIFLAYQIGAYIDEYGVMKFLSLSNILGSSTSDITITDNDIDDGGYSISNNSKPGKISLRYQPPKVKQSPAIQNATDPKYKNSSSFVYTTSNDVVWSQQNIDTVGYNYLSTDFLKNENRFKTNIPSQYDIFHTYNLDANNFAAIEDEIVSFAYKEYTISNSSGSVTVSVKNYIELQSEINRFIKKYAGELSTSDGTTASAGYDVVIQPQGYITNVQRGLFGTKVKDHKMISTLSDKDIYEKKCNSSYVLTSGTTTIVNTSSFNIGISPILNTKTLIYPITDRDTGYKTYSTKFKFEETDVASSGLFFNLTSTSLVGNAYFLELTRYALEVDVNGDNVYTYILALYYIDDSTEKIIAWIDATNIVNNILSNLPQVFVPNGTNNYKKQVDESFNLRLSHHPSQTGDGENVGELVDIFLNNVEIVGWKIPKPTAFTRAYITNVEQDSSLTLKYTADNTFTTGDLVKISGVLPVDYNTDPPTDYNITSELLDAAPTYFKTYGLYSAAYEAGGIASIVASEIDSVWTGTGVNEVTTLFKKICLPISISSDTVYGHFSSTRSIASIIKLVDNYNLIPESTTTQCSLLYEIYACEKPLKQRSVNYYFQDREFLNGLVQGYNLTNIKTFMMQTKPSVIGINYYDVQYTNPAAVSVDVLPIEYLFQYFPGDLPGDQKYFQNLHVGEHSLSYSTPINTGFRARMAIANSVPYLVLLNKDSTSTESTTVRLNLWTHEIIAPSDQEIIEKVIDYSNISEVAQVDSEWIQSKEAAYKTLNVIEKSIDGFSKTVSLDIFGNPLIQVGDIVTLTYSRNGINQQRYVVKQISHSFEQGLNTKLSLNQLSNGTSYSISIANTTIAISPSISSLSSIDSQQFLAVACDQYGNALITQPTFTWSTNSGSISSNGLYQPTSAGNVEVTAVSELISGSTEFNVYLPSYTVTYDEQGGSSVSNGIYYLNGPVKLPPAPTKSENIFLGWFTTSSGGEALTSPYYPGSGNIILYAQWLSTPTIYFDELGGTPISDIQYSIGSSINLPTTTKSGYNLLGWNLNTNPYQPVLTSPYYPTTQAFYQESLNSLSGSSFPAIAYGNSKFVIVSDSGTTTLYSSNGINWTQGTIPIQALRIIFANNKFVALSGSSIATSTDGINWDTNSIPSGNWSDITYGNGKFIIIEYGSTTALYSSNAIDWTSTTMPVLSGWQKLIYGNDKFIATSYADIPNSSAQTDIYATSTDGITWTQRTLPYIGRWAVASYGNGKYILHSSAGSYFNQYIYSSDGINWTIATSDNISSALNIYYGGDTFIAVSGYSSFIATSTDGINWIKESSLTDELYRDIAFGSNSFVIVQATTLDTLRRATSDSYTLYAKWANNNPNEYTYTFNFESTIDQYAWLYPSSTIGDPEWWVDVWYGYNIVEYDNTPILSQSTEYTHTGSYSMKVEWLAGSGDYPQAQLYINDELDFSEEIKSLTISAWVYVPTGSPDVQLNIGDGQYAAIYDDPIYITPYASTSLKDQWINLEIIVPFEDWQYLPTDTWGDLINIEPISPNSSSGFVYVDDVVVTVTGL